MTLSSKASIDRWAGRPMTLLAAYYLAMAIGALIDFTVLVVVAVVPLAFALVAFVALVIRNEWRES